MNILLTNDDGIHAEGLWALYRRLSDNHDVTVVAPDRERSAVSHGITLHEPLRIHSIKGLNGYRGFAVNGTPADCVRIGITEIMNPIPDLVVSGINPGANLGVNIHYSGTVAGAREAALYGVPGIAVSIFGFDGKHYDDAAGFVEKLVNNLRENLLPFGTILNVNIPNLPADQVEGVKISRQGLVKSRERFEKRTDHRKRIYYWPGEDTQRFENHPEVDGTVLENRYISISPLKCDTTDYETFARLQDWRLT